MKANPLERLVGEQLSSVIFVQDYLQLDFDGKRLTLNVWPTVVRLEERMSFGDGGYRDALCDLIAKTVTDASETETLITLRIDDTELQCDLREGTEIEHVVYHDKEHWAFW